MAGITVGFDGSRGAYRALDWAMREAAIWHVRHPDHHRAGRQPHHRAAAAFLRAAPDMGVPDEDN
jgi:hypothetical protein